MAVDKPTGQPVVLFPEGVVHLSSTAHEILTRCDGQNSIQTIISSLCDEYEAAEADLRNDVMECLTDLHRRKLIVFS